MSTPESASNSFGQSLHSDMNPRRCPMDGGRGGVSEPLATSGCHTSRANAKKPAAGHEARSCRRGKDAESAGAELLRGMRAVV